MRTARHASCRNIMRTCVGATMISPDKRMRHAQRCDCVLSRHYLNVSCCQLRAIKLIKELKLQG
jgi:hypothetical protein